MSPENKSDQARIARKKYLDLTSSGKGEIERDRAQILNDLQSIVVIRQNTFLPSRGSYLEINEKLRKSACLKSVHAAQLFPDEAPPQILVAWNVSDTHEFIRELIEISYPELISKARLSGDVVTLREGTNYFRCDPITLRTSCVQLLTQKNYLEVADTLLEEGYIPVDAEFNVLPTTSSKF